MIEVSRDGLLPCPFCGVALAKPTSVQHPRMGLARLHPGSVEDAGCPLSGWGFYDEQLATWNIRAPSTLQAERDRYRVALEAIVNGNPTIDSPEGHASWDFSIARTALSDAPVQS